MHPVRPAGEKGVSGRLRDQTVFYSHDPLGHGRVGRFVGRHPRLERRMQYEAEPSRGLSSGVEVFNF
jgi:hypothetical protein